MPRVNTNGYNALSAWNREPGAVHVPLNKSYVFSRENKTKPQGLRKMSRLFFSVFVIVKSSDWTRSRRKGRKDMGMEGKRP